MKTGYIMLLTPYLSENPERLGAKFRTEQVKYGLEDRNLSDEKVIIAGDYLLTLEKPNYATNEKGMLGRSSLKFRGSIRESPLLTIAGCTEMGESEVRRHKGTGLVIARYSIFYGDKSGYTGFLPEESGYSLDIPKRVDSVKEMLSDERLLDGLMERNEEKIRQAVGFLNKKLPEPIIITSYLSQALEVGRKLKNAKHKKKK